MLSYGKEVNEEQALLLILSTVGAEGRMRSGSFYPELSAKAVNELARRTSLLTIEQEGNRETFVAPAGPLVSITQEAAAIRIAAQNQAHDIVAKGEVASHEYVARVLAELMKPVAPVEVTEGSTSRFRGPSADRTRRSNVP